MTRVKTLRHPALGNIITTFVMSIKSKRESTRRTLGLQTYSRSYSRLRTKISHLSTFSRRTFSHRVQRNARITIDIIQLYNSITNVQSTGYIPITPISSLISEFYTDKFYLAHVKKCIPLAQDTVCLIEVLFYDSRGYGAPPPPPRRYI